jgi:hypothetical protein
MRGTTETMGTMLRTEFDEEKGQFLHRVVEHPFKAEQDAQTGANELATALDGPDAPPTPNEPILTPDTTDADKPDPTPIEGLRIVA